MNEDFYRSLRRRLGDRNLKTVAEHIGISPHTIYRFMKGGCEPRKSTINLIEFYLQNENSK